MGIQLTAWWVGGGSLSSIMAACKLVLINRVTVSDFQKAVVRKQTI